MKRVEDLRVTLMPAGSSRIGGGHVLRCRSLAAALELQGISCRWVASPEARSLFSQGDDVAAWGDPFGLRGEELLGRHIPPGEMVVVDSYLPSMAWFRAVGSRWRLVVVDDNREREVEDAAAAVLNPNPGAEDLPYRRHPGVRLLLGASYALLRPAFWDLSSEDRGYVFAVAGASDPQHVLLQLVRWWVPSWPPLVAVAGPLMREEDVAELQREARGRPFVEVLNAPEDFSERMAAAGRVLCTSSGTSLEALALRKPLVVFQVAANQQRIGEEISRRRWGTNLGFWGAWGPEDLARVWACAPARPPAVVNPRGAQHAAGALRALLEFPVREGRPHFGGFVDADSKEC